MPTKEFPQRPPLSKAVQAILDSDRIQMHWSPTVSAINSLATGRAVITANAARLRALAASVGMSSEEIDLLVPQPAATNAEFANDALAVNTLPQAKGVVAAQSILAVVLAQTKGAKAGELINGLATAPAVDAGACETFLGSPAPQVAKPAPSATQPPTSSGPDVEMILTSVFKGPGGVAELNHRRSQARMSADARKGADYIAGLIERNPAAVANLAEKSARPAEPADKPEPRSLSAQSYERRKNEIAAEDKALRAEHEAVLAAYEAHPRGTAARRDYFSANSDKIWAAARYLSRVAAAKISR